MNKQYGLHWFRRDLRTRGNLALQWSFSKHEGRVLGVFSFDKAFLSRSDFSSNRFHFFLKTLEDLREELKTLGSDLLFLDEGPDQAFKKLFAQLSSVGKMPASISFCRDYEPFARVRDERLVKAFERADLEVHTDRDHLLIEPHEIIKSSDPTKPFQVFTPFMRQWMSVFHTNEIHERVENSGKPLKASKNQCLWNNLIKTEKSDLLSEYLKQNEKKVSVPIPSAGSEVARKRLMGFGKRIGDYAKNRDIPGVTGTSQLSIHFKNGSLTGSQVIHSFGLHLKSMRETSGEFIYLKELVWREFYYYILYHFPHVETETFNPKYRKLKWENNEKYFKAWCEGKTGYPIVDAGMRQLNETGWMHNRVRMIVASFLTKDLLVDYRWGEKYFMEKLLDGDLAPNNGGWQWSASTGCDPQPYFRVFNPTLQGERFDPEGDYVKRFVPELKGLSGKGIHIPKNAIVDHSEQREKAIALFR